MRVLREETMSSNKVLPETHVNTPMPVIDIPLSRPLTSKELADLQAYPNEIVRLRARVAELEAALRLLADLGHHATWADINEARKTLGLSVLP
jgi:hypothetical protein